MKNRNLNKILVCILGLLQLTASGCSYPFDEDPIPEHPTKSSFSEQGSELYQRWILQGH